MRALILTDISGPGPAIGIVDDPTPGDGEVVVRLAAAALNHRELWICKGQYPGLALPATLGCDGAGVIEAVGPGVDPTRLGEDVVIYPGLGWGDDPRVPSAAFGLLGMPGPGTIAERIRVPVSHLFGKPDHLSWQQAAALPLAGLTGWRGLTTKGGLQAGERLLITGAGGGVAAQALMLARAMGAEVWVTSGADETIEWAVQNGAAGGVNYKADQWGRQLAKQAGPIDLVLDGAPAGGFAAYGRALAPGARIVIYGSSGGPAMTINAPELFLRNWTIIGSNVGNIEEFSAMLDFVAQHRIVPQIERVFPFEQASQALAFLEAGHNIGKVVIDMQATRN